MITIRPIRPEEIPLARELIAGIAYRLFGWGGSLEGSLRYYEQSGYLSDMEDVQASYFRNGGLFLAAFDDDRLVGTGAVRLLDETTAEIKRLWLLEPYHGRGIGLQLMTQLMAHARQRGCRRLQLSTDIRQTRAQALYRRLGFKEAGPDAEHEGDILMQMDIGEM